MVVFYGEMRLSLPGKNEQSYLFYGADTVPCGF